MVAIILGYKRQSGFTLAELLIALTILGVIATFTIPKVLMAQHNQGWNAEAKEAASMISGAYAVYSASNTISSGIAGDALSQYMNYVKVNTTSKIDDLNGNTYLDCSAGPRCLTLHNGGTLAYWPGVSFGGTSNTNAIFFYLDPDSTYSGSTTGNSKAVLFFLYANGRLTSYANILPNTVSSDMSRNASTTFDPDWFSW